MTDVSNAPATAVTATTPWRRLLIAAVILATIAGVTMYRKQTQALDVQVSPVSKGDLTDSILASGNLVYRTQVALRSELMARVDAVFVQEGDKVEAGQLLLQLDPQSYSASLEQARAQTARARTDIQMATTRLQNLERQLKRQQQLANKGLIQQELLDNLRSDQQLALLQQQSAQQQLAQSLAAEKQAADLLAKTELRSPISGVIVAVDVKAGETVIPGSAQMMGSDLMTIADTSALLAELRLDEADVHSVHVGQNVKVFAAAAPDKALSGKVQSISSSARQLGQSQALAFKVKVLLENAEGSLYPGMSCRAELQTAAMSQVWSVPVSALQSFPAGAVETSNSTNSRQIWLVRDSRAYPQQVEVGLATDTAQQISKGLAGTEQVITGPARVFASLQAGSKVRFDAVPTESTAAAKTQQAAGQQP